MSATGFHPEPSAKAPWTRTMVLTAACPGDDAAKAAPVRRARIKRFMLQLHKIAPPHCLRRDGTAPTVTAGNYSRELRKAKWGSRFVLRGGNPEPLTSALGQKQTFGKARLMSALPQKRTWISTAVMSALCQKQTFCAATSS